MLEGVYKSYIIVGIGIFKNKNYFCMKIFSFAKFFHAKANFIWNFEFLTSIYDLYASFNLGIQFDMVYTKHPVYTYL
jgi:hypothetical protein